MPDHQMQVSGKGNQIIAIHSIGDNRFFMNFEIFVFQFFFRFQMARPEHNEAFVVNNRIKILRGWREEKYLIQQVFKVVGL